ncbi:UNVERIFIED_CONTAM: F-box protein SKIP23 [Sesamum latifolium]|uniref:F-box protein SKIP23 n=1 Tax=Sesamum latifolium TaxID=2727402 RepID=A0AAW2TAS2_9LAMI
MGGTSRIGISCSWRFLTTPFKKFPCTPLKLPFPFQSGGTSRVKHQGAYFSLAERTVYRVQLPESKKPCFWLVKIERTEDEVCKAYTLQYMNPAKAKKNYEHKCVKKVVVSGGVKNDEYAIMAVDDVNKLWYIKSGDKKWTMVPDNYGSNNFLDVVNYKGQLYGIDIWGGTWVFDSMFELTKITHNICRPASKRHLVDLYKGELFLVEEITDKDKRVCTCYDVDEFDDECLCRFPRTPVRNTAVEVTVSRIDKGQTEWVEANIVDNQIIFVGDDCSFSVSVQKFEGCKAIRVFYIDRYICFRTEEKKLHIHDNDDYGYDDDWNCGYNYFECDCGFCSGDDDARTVDNFVPSDEVKLKFRGLHGHNTGVCDFAKCGSAGILIMQIYFGHPHLGSAAVSGSDAYKYGPS